MSKSERTRQFIIEQAAPLFNKQGYAGPDISDLMAATGLSKGAIYGHFDSKDEMAVAAFDHNLTLIKQGLWPELGDGVSAVDQLLAVPRFYRRVYPFIMAMGGCPILNATLETAVAPPPAVMQRVQQSLREWLSNLARIIREGQQRGEIRSAVDAPAYAALMVSLVEGGLLVASRLKDSAALEDALGYIEQLIRQHLAC